MSEDETNNIARLVTTKSDFDLAKELKEEILETSKPLMLAATKAKKAGFDVQLGFGINIYGEVIIANLTLIKSF